MNINPKKSHSTRPVVVVVGIPVVAIKLRPVVKTPKPQDTIARLPIQNISASPKLLASRFCISWLKININNALIIWHVAFLANLFR
jgi:hypothetical protein